MKLLTRTSIYYFIFSLIVFIVGAFIFYHAIRTIFYRQIDETLITEKKLIEETINYSDSVPDFRVIFGHLIEVTILNTPLKKFEFIKDTLAYDEDKSELVTCRQLIATNTSIDKKGYIISIYKPISETKKLITAILLAMMLLFVSLMILLLAVNYFISRRVWVPFYKTLRTLSSYDINQEESLRLKETKISEFRLLNTTLERMSRKIRRDYINLKQFNENASHELQTPLAIIKSKLELLVQSENLTESQMVLIHTVYEAVTRISRLNHGLLLISKIENNQFPATEEVDLNENFHRLLGNFEELLKMKNITVNFKCDQNTVVSMSRTLAEILISNLVSNAIRHNIQSGHIDIATSKDGFVITNTGNPLTVAPELLFERFSKSARSSDSVGLGLAIVKQIAGLYKFKIDYTYQNNLHSVSLTLSGKKQL